MIRITDRTLSCLDGMNANVDAVARFLRLLIKTEVDAIELSERMYEVLAPLPEQYRSYVLRIENIDSCKKYPDISRFVCRNSSTANVCADVLLGDIRESYTISCYTECPRVRITGLDDCLLGEYNQIFKFLREAFRGQLEFCPTNQYDCASALAAEWVMSGTGEDIVTSFGGIGGFAPTEEVIMILRVERLRKVGKSYEFFPEMAELFREITGETAAPSKPVTGGEIFHVESGIHVNGILKHPKCYEPFPPETVGRARKIVLGKQSGTSSIHAKLNELKIKCSEEQIPLLLERVKALGAKKSGAVTDAEFTDIARSCTA